MNSERASAAKSLASLKELKEGASNKVTSLRDEVKALKAKLSGLEADLSKAESEEKSVNDQLSEQQRIVGG